MTRVIAHRGASSDAPENTLAAFRLAWEQKADAVEMDLRPTRDGHIAVLHDGNLLRVSGVAAEVAAMDSAEIKSLDVGSWKGERWRGERVPLLSEALAAVPGAGDVFLELKGGSEMLPELKRCVVGSGLYPSRVWIIAFDRMLLVESKRLLPEAGHAWVVDQKPLRSFDGLIEESLSRGLDALDLKTSWPLDQERVAAAHRAGLKVYVWTVDNIGMARQLAAAGVDGITTNTPGLLRQALKHTP